MDKEHKDTMAEIKSLNDKGEGVLRFIRFNQEDKDADITLPGFIGSQKAPLIAAHNWKSDYPPLGWGESFEDGEATNFRFKLNLDDPRAQAWRSWLLMDEARLQQVSYGFRPHEDAQERKQQNGKTVRYLKPRPDGSRGADLYEVSFVMVGSGNDTAVVNIKESPDMNPAVVPVVAPAVETPQGATGDAKLPSIEDYKAFPEDRRPPLPVLINWIKLYRYHLPFLRDIRKRDGKEVSPETVSQFKEMIEECLEVCTLFNIKLMTSALLPNVEEEARLRQQYDGRLKELSESVNAEEIEKQRKLQADAQELARRASARSKQMRELFGQ